MIHPVRLAWSLSVSLPIELTRIWIGGVTLEIPARYLEAHLTRQRATGQPLNGTLVTVYHILRRWQRRLGYQ